MRKREREREREGERERQREALTTLYFSRLRLCSTQWVILDIWVLKRASLSLSELLRVGSDPKTQRPRDPKTQRPKGSGTSISVVQFYAWGLGMIPKWIFS